MGGPLLRLENILWLDGKKVIDINLNGVFYILKYQIPAMLASKGGNIVNIASILGKVGTPNSTA